jgi:hypothetical protein
MLVWPIFSSTPSVWALTNPCGEPPSPGIGEGDLVGEADADRLAGLDAVHQRAGRHANVDAPSASAAATVVFRDFFMGPSVDVQLDVSRAETFSVVYIIADLARVSTNIPFKYGNLRAMILLHARFCARCIQPERPPAS